MTHEEAVAECNRLLEEMGRDAARRVMVRTVAGMLGPDEMEALADEECRGLLDMMEQHNLSSKPGITRDDIDTAISVFRLALIREGRRIAIGLDCQGGTA